MSLSQLERRFKAMFQVTPAQFIIKVRLTEACQSLAHTRDPITRIAERTGFYDASHFCRVFARFFGLTPSEYRESFLAARPLPA